MVFTSGGLLNVKLKTTGEHFTADRPKTLINNIIIGSLYVDLDGDTTVTNHSTGDYCKLQFVTQGFWGRDAQKIVGQVFDTEGNERFTLSGTWSDSIHLTDNNSFEKVEVWRRNENPDGYENYFFLPQFAMNLNNNPNTL